MELLSLHINDLESKINSSLSFRFRTVYETNLKERFTFFIDWTLQKPFNQAYWNELDNVINTGRSTFADNKALQPHRHVTEKKSPDQLAKTTKKVTLNPITPKR